MAVSIGRSERLHPEVRAVLEAMDAQNAPPLGTLEPAQARELRKDAMKMIAAEPEPLARVEDLTIAGPGGDLRLRVYATGHSGPRPALVYFHGGGFVFGDLDSHDNVCRALAKDSGAIVVAVDYRLAPEHKFPAAVDDAFAATLWIAANAALLGIDADHIAVGGDSAGANLATVAATRCRDAGGPRLAAQILIYPVADLSSLETESHRQFGEVYFLTRGAMEYFTRHYLPSADEARHPEASPLLAQDLRGLPPALIVTAEFDPLRDEGEAYAQRLQQAGVPVTVSRYPGMIHGFVSMHGAIAGGRDAIHQAAQFLASVRGRHAAV